MRKAVGNIDHSELGIIKRAPQNLACFKQLTSVFICPAARTCVRIYDARIAASKGAPETAECEDEMMLRRLYEVLVTCFLSHLIVISSCVSQVVPDKVASSAPLGSFTCEEG